MDQPVICTPFQEQKNPNYWEVKFQVAEVRPNVFKFISAIIEELQASKEVRCLLVDFEDVRYIDRQVHGLFAQAARKLKTEDKKFYSYNLTEKLLNEILREGLDDVFNPRESKAAIFKDAKLDAQPKAGFDVEFINPFIDGTIKTLKVQAGLDSKPGKPYLKGKGPEVPTDIAGVLGLNGKGFSGSVAICFTKSVFLEVVFKLTGERYNEINDENMDAAGEVLNIVYGFAKTVLNEKERHLEKSIPTVISGKDLSIKHMVESPVVVLPFDTAVGNFSILIGADTKTKKK